MRTFTTIRNIFEGQIKPLEPLELDVEVAAIEAARDGDQEAHHTLLTAYTPALRAAAARESKRLGGGADTIDEVRSLVLLAFTEAIKTTTGERLAGNLPHRIRHALHNDLPSPSAVSVPPRTYSRFVEVLAAAGGDPELAEELAPTMHMSVDVLRAVRDARGMWTSLDGLMEAQADAGIGGSGAGSIDATMRSAYVIEPGFAAVEAAAQCRVAFAAVDKPTEEVIRDAYGFTDYDPIPDAEIAHRRGYSRSKVQRIRTEGLATMRVALGHKDDEVEG